MTAENENQQDAGPPVITQDAEDCVADAPAAGEDEDAAVVNANVDHYKFLGPNTPPPGNRKIRKCGNSLFGKGTAMRLKFGHPGLQEGFTHQCTCPLKPSELTENGLPFCGMLLSCGYNKINRRWVSTKSCSHMKRYHPESEEGMKSAKRIKLLETTKEDNMFQAGMNAAAASRPSPPNRHQASIAPHYQLSPDVVDLTASARFYVYGRQRISKATFDDSYFKDAMMGSNKNRSMLSKDQLEQYVRAEFSLFIVFLKFIVKKKLAQTMGNAFAQGLHDGVTLGNHKGYESLGIDVVDTDWERNLPICVGFREKPQRADGTFDGTDKAVAALFEDTLQTRAGYSLKTIMAGMRSDRAATGVARQLGLEVEGCLMHDVDKLGQSLVGSLLRRDMTKPIGRNGHRPYANPFPEGIMLMKKAKSMGHYYSFGSRFSALMKLRETAKLETKSSATRIKVCCCE